MLHKLQYLNKEVGIVSGNSLLLLWPSPCSINTFCLIQLVRHGWPWFCLWWYSTHVSCRLWSWGHNRGRHTLEMRTNGTWHDIPNTTHLRAKWGRKEGGFKRLQNQMGKARPLNLLNTTAWLMLTCSHPRLFCLHLGDRALALCVLASCVYMQRQRQEASKQAMEGKDANSTWKRHQANKHDKRGKQRNKKASKQVDRPRMYWPFVMN